MKSSDLSLTIFQLLFQDLIVWKALMNISKKLVTVLLFFFKSLSQNLIVLFVLFGLNLQVWQQNVLVFEVLNFVLFVFDFPL